MSPSAFPDPLALGLGLLLFAALMVAGVWWPALWRSRRHRRLARQPFPAHWRSLLRRRLPLLRRLPPDLQLQLRRRMLVFLAEKPFIGCDGLQVTDEMRVLVAAQACLLVLNRSGEHYAGLRQILLYPSAYRAPQRRTDGDGVQHQHHEIRLGESWPHGSVVLSWPDVLAGAADPSDGQNLVIHEFAHQLDQARGHASGAPFLGQRQRYARWARVLQGEFDRLRASLQRGQGDLLPAYAATDPAEFFACASEVFFEQPEALAASRPALYAELARYYAVHPLAWS